MQLQRSDTMIRRLVVAMDASPCSRSVLRSAAHIAAHLGVRLEGIFVQDAGLHRLAALQMVQEISIPSAQMRSFSVATLEREYGVLIERAESWGSDVSKKYNVQWHFDVRRGAVAAQLMAAAGEGDLLSLGRSGWPLVSARQRPMGSVVRTVIGHHPFPLFVLEREIQAGQPVFVSADAGFDERQLYTAARLAELYASPLIVLVSAEAKAAGAILSQVDRLLADRDLDIIYRQVTAQSLAKEVSNSSNGRHSTLVSRRGNGAEDLSAALFLW